jgi:hypothetical protein
MVAELLGASAVAVALGAPPPPPVLDCGDRITGAVVIVGGVSRPYEFVARKGDTIAGPLAFSGARDYGRTQAAWDDMVRRDQWLKTIAMLKSGRRVTVEIPAEQRAWMKLEYAHGTTDPVHVVRMEACRRPGRTPWSGGFTIDYATAPEQGRCAEIIIRVDGRPKPLRRRLFGAPASFCRS